MYKSDKKVDALAAQLKSAGLPILRVLYWQTIEDAQIELDGRVSLQLTASGQIIICDWNEEDGTMVFDAYKGHTDGLADYLKRKFYDSRDLVVRLESVVNPDHDFDYNRPIPEKFVKVASLKDARAAVDSFLNETGIGGGNFTGGQVFAGHEQVARISYNRRVWDMSGAEISIS